MNLLKNRLVGQKIKSIEAGPFDWGIEFEDGGLTVFTKMEIVLFSKETEMVVSNVEISEKSVLISVGKISSISISLDSSLLVGPEFYLYKDTDVFIVG